MNNSSKNPSPTLQSFLNKRNKMSDDRPNEPNDGNESTTEIKANIKSELDRCIDEIDDALELIEQFLDLDQVDDDEIDWEVDDEEIVTIDEDMIPS